MSASLDYTGSIGCLEQPVGPGARAAIAMRISRRSYLVQILLPLCDARGKVFPASLYKVVKSNLSSRFQGLTAYSRMAADGLWRAGKKMKPENIVVYEVMVPSLDFKWWRDYRSGLEKMFDQDGIVIRAQKVVTP